MCVYATVFFLVNLSYISLFRELVDRPDAKAVSPRLRATMRFRATVTLIVFAVAAIVALWPPRRLRSCLLLPCDVSASAGAGTLRADPAGLALIRGIAGSAPECR